VDRTSTRVGEWLTVKVRRDADHFIASRWQAAADASGSRAQQDRNIKALASRMTSTNTIVLR
jgi:hypothetical protein